MKIKTGEVTQYVDFETTLLNVPWFVVDEDEAVLKEGNQSFPLSASKEEIQDFLKRVLDLTRSNAETAEESKARQEELDRSSEVGRIISNQTIE